MSGRSGKEEEGTKFLQENWWSATWIGPGTRRRIGPTRRPRPQLAAARGGRSRGWGGRLSATAASGRGSQGPRSSPEERVDWVVMVNKWFLKSS